MYSHMYRCCALVLLLAFNANAEVLFEDNFDDHSDWGPTQNSWPTTTSVSSSNGATDGSTACSTCPDGTAEYRGYYIASSAWDSYKGEDTLQINDDNYRGDSGKALTLWMEPINSSHCDGGTYWCSDGQLSVSLPDSYDEIYIRYYIKFDSSFVWDVTNSSSKGKFLRATHLHEIDGESMYAFGYDGNHFPAVFLDFSDQGIYSIDNTQVRLMPRFQSSYHEGATPDPDYLTNNDYEGYFVSGGTGTNGNKTFEELLGDGEWHCIELRLEGNSAMGEEDGEWQTWIDGTSVALRTNVAWADEVYNCAGGNCINPPDDFVGWNWVSIGGNFYNRYYASTVQTEQWYAIDDLVISTTYVGTDYVIGGSSSGGATFSGMGNFN